VWDQFVLIVQTHHRRHQQGGTSPEGMAPFNRFAPSKYKNQLLEPAKNDKSFSELPSIVPATNPNGRSIACGYKNIAFSLGTNVSFLC
jgi:hypothetical protein